MLLEIITPDKKVYSGEVTSVSVPGSSGRFQMLENHAPIISTLLNGKVKVKDKEGVKEFDVKGGVVENLKNKVVRRSQAFQATDGVNTLGDDPLTELHMRNFVDAVRGGAKLNAPIEDGAKTGTLCHLGTISQQLGRKLAIDPKNGHILHDAEAMQRWSREYDPRWKPVV